VTFVPPAENHEAIKLREIGGAVLGSSGWALYDDILEHYIAKKKRIALHDRASIFTFFVQFWKELPEAVFLRERPAGKGK
jgi:hypothetical protein